MTEPLHVAHAVLSLDFGGLERIVLHLTREGLKLGQRVSVLCLERPGTLAAQVEAAGARVLCLGKAPGIRPGMVGRLKAVFRDLTPDVVHTHQIGALLYAGPAARRVGVGAVVHTEHINHVVKLKSRAARLRMRLLWALAGRYAHRFCCVSQDIADEVAAYGVVPRRKVSVVLNGIDTDCSLGRDEALALRGSLGIPADAPVVGTVGRLNEVKRQDLLIRAFARVRAHAPDARLLLVGDGPARDDLARLVAEVGLGDAVHFAGYQAEPERYLAAMDVFALTSRIEGMPLAVLEAWAAGLPVIASRVGGLPDMIAEGRTGLLFPSGDEDALTAGLRGLLADRERAGQLGRAGRDHVRAHFDLGRMARDYEGHYLDALARRGARAASAP